MSLIFIVFSFIFFYHLVTILQLSFFKDFSFETFHEIMKSSNHTQEGDINYLAEPQKVFKNTFF